LTVIINKFLKGCISMTAVIYARYSDSKQREESIEGQIKVCTDFAEKEGLTLVGQYIDRAISGKTDHRPQFQQMIRDSSKKKFERVIVYQLDRFARNRYDSAHYKNILKENGVLVVSANENIAEDASGILMESVLEGMAEYYSAELSQKVTRGHSVNAERCLSNGGVTPLGYKIVNKHYVLDEEAAPIVQEIFKKYASGWSISQIYASLNERHLMSAQGKPFNKNSLHTMLKNRKYLGIYIYNGVEIPGGMPQIIDQELFDKVQEKMIANKKAPGRARAKAEYILSGKLYCGYCKEKMVGHSSNQISKKGVIFNYYKCKNSGSGKPCKKKMVHKNAIEDRVVSECRRLLNPQNIKKIAKEVVNISLSLDDQSEMKRLEKALAELETAKKNQMDSLRKCDNDSIRNMIFDDLNSINAESEELTRQLEIERTRHHAVSEAQVIEYLNQLSKGDVDDITYRKSLIRLFVNKIFLYDDKFTITFNTGDDEVTITDSLLEKIETSLRTENLCISNNPVHQKQGRVS